MIGKLGRRTAKIVASALTTCWTVTGAAYAAPAPPVSDGSSGSFSAQLTSNFNVFNVDNGHAQGCGATSCPYDAYVPYKTVRYAGQTMKEYNFTDMDMAAGNPPITIYGSGPALFLANQGISIGGQLIFRNYGPAGVGGADAQNKGTAVGGSGGGVGGGAGGSGPGGEASDCGGTVGITASGGGGGGYVSPGAPGLPGFYPQGASYQPNYPGGAGGASQTPSLHVGAGGGGGGGGSYEGDYYASLGGAGGGAIVFSSTSTISIGAQGLITVTGNPGETQQATDGSGGGGSGGTVWLFSSGAFTNAGSIVAAGGAGGTNMEHQCDGTPAAGPDGGNGSGGYVFINAQTIANSGTINVSQGGGGTAAGGKVKLLGTVTKSGGHIIGRSGYAR